jgi:integrase
MRALFVLAISSGMRQGELLALRWDDVDLEAGVLRVQRSLSHSKDGPLFTAPKTSKSPRRIKLTATTTDALKRHRAAQNSHRLKLGTLWENLRVSSSPIAPAAQCGPGPLRVARSRGYWSEQRSRKKFAFTTSDIRALRCYWLKARIPGSFKSSLATPVAP